MLCAGSFDKFLNIQITLIIILQLLMCALHGSLALWWRNQHGNNRYYLATTITGQVRPLASTDLELRQLYVSLQDMRWPSWRWLDTLECT
jgi:hypothetical protein